MGITEQNGFRMWISIKRANSYLYSISTFITRRSYEQLLLDVGIMNLPVLILGVGGGTLQHGYLLIMHLMIWH